MFFQLKLLFFTRVQYTLIISILSNSPCPPSPNKAFLPSPCPILLSHLFLENNPLSQISAAYDCGTIHQSFKKIIPQSASRPCILEAVKLTVYRRQEKLHGDERNAGLRAWRGTHILYGDAHRCSGTLRTATLL